MTRGQRRRRVALAFVVAAGLALATAVSGQAYYPASDGLSWTYSSGETQTYTGGRDLNGAAVLVLTHFFEGIPISEDYLQTTEAGGVVTLGTAAGGQTLLYTPPLTVYPTPPLQVGQRWQSSTRVADLDITLASEVIGIRGVATPAGRFNALQIRQQTLTSSGAQTVLDLYFVPSVGVVRYQTQDGTVIDLIEKNF